jgi:hypothetical protein
MDPLSTNEVLWNGPSECRNRGLKSEAQKKRHFCPLPAYLETCAFGNETMKKGLSLRPLVALLSTPSPSLARAHVLVDNAFAAGLLKPQRDAF